MELKSPFAMRVYQWNDYYIILRYPNISKKEYFHHVYSSTLNEKLAKKSIHVTCESAENEIDKIIRKTEKNERNKNFYKKMKNNFACLIIFLKHFFAC